MFLLSVFSLFGYCFALKRVSRWSIEAIPFFVISALASLLYFLGLFNGLVWGTKALVFLGLGLLLLAPWYLKGRGGLLRCLTPSFLFLCLFCLFFGFFTAHSHLYLWDEFSQWGARAKLMALQHHLFSDSSVLARPDYPPGAAVFYYWFFVFSGYSEGIAHMAQQLLILLPLGVLVKGYSWRHWQRAFLVLSFAVLILLLLHVRMASEVTLYVDNIVGIYFGIMLASYYFSKRQVSDVLFLIPAVFFFVLLKSDLIGLVVFLCAFLMVAQWVCHSTNGLKNIFAVMVLLIAGLLSYYSWQFYLPTPGLWIESVYCCKF